MAYLTPQTDVKTRLTQATNNVSQWSENGKSNTSSGARLEMWKASFEVIKENPIIGVGEDNYAKHQQKLIDQGKIDKFVGHFAHPHGEYLTGLVEQGTIGLFFLILLFLSPLKYLFEEAHKNLDAHQKSLVGIGVLIILHYLFYSFTATVFAHQSSTLFYAVFLSIVIGTISMKKHRSY